jgi:hypothetical protein
MGHDMRRTKFYSKVLDFAIERKFRELRQKKAKRDNAKALAENDSYYRIGPLICVDKVQLTQFQKAFLDDLRALGPGGKVELDDFKKLLRLINLLLAKKDALMLIEVDANEIDDGGSEMRKAG